MRTTMALLCLLIPVLAGAAQIEIPISTQSIGIVNYGGRILESFNLDLGGLDAGDLLEATLELRVTPQAPEGERYVEVQAAVWTQGVPTTPAGRAGYVAELVADRDEDAVAYLDITPIIADALASAQSEPTIVVGAIGEDALPGATVIAWDNGQDIWGTVRILHR
jgi:hypothetical protein